MNQEAKMTHKTQGEIYKDFSTQAKKYNLEKTKCKNVKKISIKDE